MSEWQPIETAPKDGSTVLLGNEHGCWAARYRPVYPSGYRPDNPWASMMLNHEHMRKGGVLLGAPPTHWMPLPPPPAVAQRPSLAVTRSGVGLNELLAPTARGALRRRKRRTLETH